MWSKGILYTTILALAGCMSTEVRYNTAQVNQYKWDCNGNNSTFESQVVTEEDRIRNGLIVSSGIGWISSLLDGTLDERYRIARGERSNAQRVKTLLGKGSCPP